jgi:hypothetical protein
MIQQRFGEVYGHQCDPTAQGEIRHGLRGSHCSQGVSFFYINPLWGYGQAMVTMVSLRHDLQYKC